MTTKTIDITYKGSPAQIEIKKFSFGTKNKLLREATTCKMINKEVIVQTDPYLLRELALVYGISSAPFDTTLEGIRALDDDLGNKLFKEIDEFNKVDSEKKE